MREGAGEGEQEKESRDGGQISRGCTGCLWPGAGGRCCRVASVRRGPGCPVLDTPSSRRDLPQAKVEPFNHAGGTSGKAFLRNGKMLQGQRGVKGTRCDK